MVHKLVKLLLRGATSLVVGLGLAILVVLLCQDLFIFPGLIAGLTGRLPDRTTFPKGAQVEMIKSYDGVSLEVWHQSLDNGRTPKGTVLFFHGNASFVDMTPSVQAFVDELDLDVYSLEFRGFGRSEGWPSEVSFQKDAEYFYDYVVSQKGVDPESVVIMAESVGTGTAAYLASKRNVPILVLMAAYSSIPDVVYEDAIFSLLTPFVRYNFPVSEYLESLKDTCAILVHGERDGIISFKNLERNRKALESHERAHVLTYEEGRHFLWFIAKEDVQSKLSACFQST